MFSWQKLTLHSPLQVHGDAGLAGHGKGSAACASLKRLLQDSALAAGIPAVERCCPSSLALCALSGENPSVQQHEAVSFESSPSDTLSLQGEGTSFLACTHQSAIATDMSEPVCKHLPMCTCVVATDPHHGSSASEALKDALHSSGILRRLAALAVHHASALAPATSGRTAARCMLLDFAMSC